MKQAIQFIIIISLFSSCGGNIAWKHPDYIDSFKHDADKNECHRKAKELAAFTPQRSTFRQTTPGMVGYTTAALNAAAADNLTNAIFGAIRTGTIYRPEYKKCMKDKGYYEEVESLIEDLKDDEDALRQYAAATLGKIKDPRAVDPLIAALQDKNDIVQRYAAMGLGEIKDPRAVDPLITTLSVAKSGEVRQCAADALKKVTGKDYAIIKQTHLEQLIEDLNNDHATTRWEAAKKLGKLKDEEAIDPLMKALKDEHPFVRRRAAVALGELNDHKAIDALIASLKDEDSFVRRYSSEALEGIAGQNYGEDILKWQEWWEKNKAK